MESVRVRARAGEWIGLVTEVIDVLDRVNGQQVKAKLLLYGRVMDGGMKNWMGWGDERGEERGVDRNMDRGIGRL